MVSAERLGGPLPTPCRDSPWCLPARAPEGGHATVGFQEWNVTSGGAGREGRGESAKQCFGTKAPAQMPVDTETEDEACPSEVPRPFEGGHRAAAPSLEAAPAGDTAAP